MLCRSVDDWRGRSHIENREHRRTESLEKNRASRRSGLSAILAISYPNFSHGVKLLWRACRDYDGSVIDESTYRPRCDVPANGTNDGTREIFCCDSRVRCNDFREGNRRACRTTRKSNGPLEGRPKKLGCLLGIHTMSFKFLHRLALY